ncbi:MAG: hypothetical protein LLF80_06880 [Porphyromonadaceae bacterium]|nr:hypothetical protein [Porphyromonadaceae bacterium]
MKNIKNDRHVFIVLNSGKMAYTRKDGVKVIPVGCLKDKATRWLFPELREKKYLSLIEIRIKMCIP